MARPASFLVLIAFSINCASGAIGGGSDTDAPEGTPTPSDAIDQYIWSLDTLPAPPPSVVESDPSDDVREGDYMCSTQNLQETRQYDRIVAYAANSDSLWPGAIVRGDSVYEGLFTQLVFDRAPLTISVSLENLAGARSVEMPSPSLAESRDALGEVLAAEVTGATPANIYAEIEQVHSQEQLSIALGASVEWSGVFGVSSSFDFNEEDIRSRYVVKYTQAYYTVDVDQPARPSDFFTDAVTLDEVRRKMDMGNPPVFVSSVTYGRMVVFTFESEYSAEEVGAALEFVYRGGVDVSGDVSVTYKDIVSQSKITAYILGGSGGEAARAIDDYDALMEFIRSGGDYSRESPGAPIAYKLAYLADNAPARLSFTEDYEIRMCERVSQKVKVTLESIEVVSDGGDAYDNLEIYGTIYAVGVDGTNVLLHKDEGDSITIDEGATWPTVGPISETIVEVEPQAGSEIRLAADLSDDDGILPSDSLGYEQAAAPFELGWRRSQKLFLTGSNAQVVVTFSMEPI